MVRLTPKASMEFKKMKEENPADFIDSRLRIYIAGSG